MNPEMLQILQALQGNSGTAGMVPGQGQGMLGAGGMPGAGDQQIGSLGNGTMPNMYSALASPPPMTPPPESPY